MTLNPPNSGSPVSVAQVTLTSAQVLACFTTAVTIVPAPGAGLVLVPVVAFVNYTFVTTAYTDHGGTLNIGIPTGTYAYMSITTLGLWNAGDSRIEVESAQAAPPASISNMVNKPLQVYQSTANPTLGDGTLTVTVLYSVVAVS